MPKCCICGKNASRHYTGLWWCREHLRYIDEGSNLEAEDKDRSLARTDEIKQGPIELNLKRI